MRTLLTEFSTIQYHKKISHYRAKKTPTTESNSKISTINKRNINNNNPSKAQYHSEITTKKDMLLMTQSPIYLEI